MHNSLKGKFRCTLLIVFSKVQFFIKEFKQGKAVALCDLKMFEQRSFVSLLLCRYLIDLFYFIGPFSN